jgi:short-subunit dehydrogenase
MNHSPVIVISGASSGIGESAARLFGRNGFRVVLAARRMERLEAIAGEILENGGESIPIKTDVSILEDIQHLVQSSIEKYKDIDILFNNAGFGRISWLENLRPKVDIQELIRVNLLGTIWTTQAFLPHMIERKKGHIINMASFAGLVATPTYSLYAASKFGVHGFSEALRREVRIHGIRVSGIYPGGADTEFKQQAGIKRRSGLTTPRRMRLSADEIAQAVFDLVQRPRRMIILPRSMILIYWLNILMPGIVDWATDKYFVQKERTNI